MNVIGIDEVGRGALAGPVAVAAVFLPHNVRLKNKSLGPLKDSKKLSPKQREAWFEYFKTIPGLTYAIARVYPRQIEKRNISACANLAAHRAFMRLTKGRGRQTVFLDGGLYLKNKNLSMTLRAKTIVRGDEKIPAIAAASIIAKVSRDRFMRKLGRKYPGYGFEIHKGYGTKVHLAAIRRLGSSKVHRKTFLVS